MIQGNEMIVSATRQTPVMKRREMVQIPAVMAALRPIEKAVFVASTDKTISEYTGAELTEELAVTLKWISKDIGYRPTDEADKQYLVIRTAEILKRYYAELTVRDFRMAFEMSVTGSLDDFLPRGRDGQPDRGHYQQFNADYICKILNAYKRCRAIILLKAHEAAPKPEPVQDERIREYYRTEIRKECINAFYHFKYRGYLPAMSPIAEMLYYNILSAVGLADEIVVTLAEQTVIFNRIANQLSQRGMMADLKRLQAQGPAAPELEHGSFALARHRALKRAFARMIEDEIQITDYVTIGNVV